MALKLMGKVLCKRVLITKALLFPAGLSKSQSNSANWPREGQSMQLCTTYLVKDVVTGLYVQRSQNV